MLPTHRPKAAPLFVLISWALVPVGVNSVQAQNTLSVRTPEVSGTVVDFPPLDYVGPGQNVYPTETAVVYDGIAMAKTVLEFNVSDLVPGVMESARIRGRLVPDTNQLAVARSISFALGIGDGAIAVDDNSQAGMYHAGYLNHTSAVPVPYNFDVTSELRYHLLGDPDFVKQLVTPDTMARSYDSIANASLEIVLRPTDRATKVYYKAPTVAAAAHAQNGSGFSINSTSTRAEVMNWTYAPFEQGRAIMEFDLSSIPQNAIIKWAKLDVSVVSLQGQFNDRPDLQVVGYLGNVQADATDLAGSGLWVGQTGRIGDTGPNSWNISSELVQTALENDTWLGLRFQPGIHPQLRASITLRQERNLGWEPRLAIAYVLPEPAAMPLIFLSCAVCGIRRDSRVRSG